MIVIAPTSPLIIWISRKIPSNNYLIKFKLIQCQTLYRKIVKEQESCYRIISYLQSNNRKITNTNVSDRGIARLFGAVICSIPSIAATTLCQITTNSNLVHLIICLPNLVLNCGLTQAMYCLLPTCIASCCKY